MSQRCGRGFKGFSFLVLNKWCLLSLIASQYSERKQILDNKPDPAWDRYSVQGRYAGQDLKFKHPQHARNIKFILLKGNILSEDNILRASTFLIPSISTSLSVSRYWQYCFYCLALLLFPQLIKINFPIFSALFIRLLHPVISMYCLVGPGVLAAQTSQYWQLSIFCYLGQNVCFSMFSLTKIYNENR